MHNRSRRALTAAESALLLQRRQLIKQEAMSVAQVRGLIYRTIDQALTEHGHVSRTHLLMANVPADAIDRHFRTILQQVVSDRARRGITA